jgi:hypothetical protein
MKIVCFILSILVLSISISGCKENDDLPPVLTLTGAESVNHILNNVYNDDGAEAIDETDGNITKNIYIENSVNVNKIGEYTVIYHVVDQAGNEAIPVTRHVSIYNEGYIYSSQYNITETEIFTGNNMCNYNIMVAVDSFLNKRLVFSGFACDTGREVFVDFNDSLLLLPYQLIADSLSAVSVQGSGTINDTLMFLDYQLKNDSIKEFWNAEINRMK